MLSRNVGKELPLPAA